MSIFFKALRSLQWHVIEQPAQVACGRCDFESEELRFHETIGQCLSIEPDPNVLLLSGVLPYLEDPYQELEYLLSYNIPTVIIDRTAFLPGDRDRLTVEQVPADIYDASYPFWFLSETKFPNLEKKLNFPNLPPVDPSLLPRASGYFEGFILERTLG